MKYKSKEKSCTGQKSRLQSALEKQVIPHLESFGNIGLFQTASDYRAIVTDQVQLPAGMTAQPCAIKGPQISVRPPRAYEGGGIVHTQWPEDNLQAMRSPKLCFVISGQIYYRIADYVLNCHSGHILPIPSGVPFAKVLDRECLGQGACEIIQMLPNRNSLNCWLSHKWIDDKGKFHNQAEVASILGSRVPEHIHQLLREIQNSDKYCDIMQANWLRILVIDLLRELKDAAIVKVNDRPKPIQINGDGIEQDSSLINQVQNYIQQNLSSGTSLDKAASYVYMSRSVFTEIFKEHTGMTFNEYVNKCRVDAASRLLRHTDLTVNQVGKTVGITTARLRTLFYEKYNISPKAYRDQFRK